MSNFGPAPSRMTAKFRRRSIRDPTCRRSDSTVRAFGRHRAVALASVPWQNRQFFVYSALPAAIDAGFDATGFFSFLASALPARILRADGRRTRAIHPRVSAEKTTRRMMARLLGVMSECGR